MFGEVLMRDERRHDNERFCLGLTANGSRRCSMVASSSKPLNPTLVYSPKLDLLIPLSGRRTSLWVESETVLTLTRDRGEDVRNFSLT